MVFGGLVPYGEVWRTGANASTKISFSTAVKLNGVDVPAGTYALYTIPGKTAWTVIIDKDTSLWGRLRLRSQRTTWCDFTATPVPTCQASLETFTIDIGDLRDESATLYLVWEKTLRADQARSQRRGAGRRPNRCRHGFDGQEALRAGRPVLPRAQPRPGKALAWTDAALAEKPAFNVFYLKARILAKTGDKEGAIAAANRSIELAAKAEGPVKEEYTRLNQELISSLR